MSRVLGKTQPLRWGAQDRTRSVQGRCKAATRPASSLHQRARSTHKLGSATKKTRAAVVSQQDKEQLYEEVMRLKRSLNDTRQENARLKAQIKQAEAELSQNNRLIKDLTTKLGRQHYGTCAAGNTMQPDLLAGLKRRNKELRSENRALKDDAAALRRDIKFTNAREIEAEARMYAEECSRLRRMLDEPGEETKKSVGGSSTTKKRDEEDALATMKGENAELTADLRKSETMVAEYREKLKAKQEENERLTREREAEVKGLRQKVEETKKAQMGEAAKKLAEKDDAIRTLEMKLVEVRRSKDLEIKKLKEQQFQQCTNPLCSSVAVGPKYAEEAGSEQAATSTQKKRVPPISSQESALASATLRLNLILSHVPPQTFLSVFFPA